METIVWIILATLLNGLVAFVGVFSLWMSKKKINKIIFILVAFSAGALLSGAFFHLLTEALEYSEPMDAFIYLMSGFILFFIIEKFLHWHHHHAEKHEVHPFTYLILFGDGIHNFIDGLVIAASFLINPQFGVITTALIISHEIPQEIGDFGVLIYGGFGRTKALFANFLSQLTCVIGGIIGYYMSAEIQSFSVILLPFAAGGFIYIAASDLIPELHKETNIKKYSLAFIFFLLGLLLVLGLKLAIH